MNYPYPFDAPYEPNRNDQFVSKQNQVEHRRKVALWDAYTSMYSLTDSILCSSTIKVRAGDFSHQGIQAPAWNDGETIFLNTNILAPIDDASIVSLNGVNYHEVAHLLFSPRLNQAYAKRVIDAKLMQEFNILEDCRIETLLIAKYPSVRDSLVQTVLRYIAEGDMTESFILIRGRKYLPVAVRQLSANAYVSKYGVEFTNKVASIIDEYRLLAFPRDEERGFELLKQLNELFNEQGQDGKDSGRPKGGEGMCNDRRKPVRSGRPMSAKEQSELQESIKDDEDVDIEDEIDEDIEDETPGSNSSAGPDEQNDAESNESNESNNNQHGNLAEMLDELKNACMDAIDELMESSEQIQAEIRQTKASVRANDKVVTSLSHGCAYVQSIVSLEARAMSRRFEQELNQLVVEADAFWVSHQSSGRLNINRAMNASMDEYDELFDRWSESVDAYDIEAVILLDKSLSMQSDIKQAAEATWIIKRALESINARVTAYTFNQESSLLYSGDVKATPNKFHQVDAHGGTNPFECLSEAHRILESSKRKTKLLIMVSDGDFDRSVEEKCNNIVSEMNRIEGVITASVALMSKSMFEAQKEKFTHNCRSVTVVEKPTDLVNVARNLVKSLR